jgi:outer membrane receptor for Fe3+-dicitrate
MVSTYGSGLPVDIDGAVDLNSLVSQYGQQIIDRVNFDAGRVRPSFTLDASLGADLWKLEKRTLRLQMVVENLTNRLNVINFAGLFSGTAIAPPRAGSIRLQYDF